MTNSSKITSDSPEFPRDSGDSSVSGRSPLTNGRTTLRMDEGWRFHAGDVPAPVANKHLAAYMANKAGCAPGAARGNYDDSDWPAVTFPHDWSLDGPFDPANHVNSGFLPRGVGWYRRTFKLDEADRGRVLRLRFDGIASHATIFVNGHLLARSYSGYLPVDVDFSDVANYGDDLNAVAVRVDATPMDGWWYEGAGIYRHVWLTKRSAFHIADDGLIVRTRPGTGGVWRTLVTARFGPTVTNQHVAMRVRIRAPDGGVVGEIEGSAVAAAGSTAAQTCLTVGVRSPRLWEIDAPHLYTAECELLDAGVVIDQSSARFGYRTIAFVGSAPADRAAAGEAKRSAGADPTASSAGGFFLNGRHVLLKGACVHQDHAGVGVGVPDSIHRFRVQRLKDMGTNAVRIGHHPPAAEFLDACDELGLLVMDENRSFGSSPEHLAQLRAMVRRDINHPSVVLWSVCNEEAIQGTAVARTITETMVREVKRLDDTRPVTAAISGGILNDGGMSEAIDVMSINYSFATLDPFHEKWPKKPVVSSETGCTLSTRGVYQTDPAKFQFASYDDDYERWGSPAHEAWRQISSRPWMAGLFVWTGFDYRGEPSPHTWPSVTSHWGLMDLCGFDKDAFWRHRAWFVAEPVLHLLPHWNWAADFVGATSMSPAAGLSTVAGDIDVAPKSADGRSIRVQAISNCDEVELTLNGRSLGRKKIDPIDFAEWAVPFEPGVLRAVGYRGGVEVAAAVRETTGPAVALGVELHPSAEATFVADGETAWPFTVFATDAAGRRVPDTNAPLTIEVEGEAVLLGVGNGDPNGHFANRGPAVPLFSGLAQAIVRATTTAGRVTVRAISPELAGGVMAFDTIAGIIRPAVPSATRRHFLADWLMSPITPMPPDISAGAAGTDMNTWERVKAGGPQTAWSTANGYTLYRATLKPPKAMATTAGRLVFEGVDGEAEVFIDGIAVAEGSGRIEVDLPPRSTPAEVVVRLKGADASAGLNGPVEVFLVPSPGTPGKG